MARLEAGDEQESNMDPMWLIVVQVGSMLVVAVSAWAAARATTVAKMNGFEKKLTSMHEQIVTVVTTTETNREAGEGRLNKRLDDLDSKFEVHRRWCQDRTSVKGCD